MRIEQYITSLKTLTEKEIEMVRQWRNKDVVRFCMDYQSIISAEAQKHWFQNLDASKNNFFTIWTEDKAIGLIHLKNIDTKTRSAEAGIFIGEEDYLNTFIPFLSTLTLMDFAFYYLNITTLYAKIKTDNLKVIEFNKGLGYQFEKKWNEHFDYYAVQQEMYEASKLRFQTLLKKWQDNVPIIYLNASELKPPHPVTYFTVQTHA
jgi:RimJ/RimL family protein N-acetyltransferase